MFGGFIGTNQNRGGDWGENLLNSVASNTIRHLFTRSEMVDVEVRCHPSSKLLQGSIDSFKMHGRGLVIRRDFRTEEMSFETDAVSLDFSSVLKGEISLKQPTQALATVKLAEVDINKAFKADLVRKRLENLSEPSLLKLSGNQPVSFTDIELNLLAHNRIQLFAKANLGDRVVPVSLSCKLGIAKRRRVTFTEAQFEPDAVPPEVRETSQQLSETLVEVLNNMVDLDRFNLDGVKLRLNSLKTQGNLLIFTGYAQIDRVPKVG
jgi:hypothetical protein